MTAGKHSILLVEDDLNLGFLLSDFLETEGYKVKLCRDGESGLRAFERSDYDLCLLDVMMPKRDGFTLAEMIREKNEDAPIIFLTAKSLKEDKLKGFKIGCDDYITKPFDEQLLLCRINAVMKRAIGDNAIPSFDLGEFDDVQSFQIGSFHFDSSRQELILGDKVRRITEKENEVLRLLCLRQNQILKRDEALMAIYGEADYFLGRSFDVFITKLRRYLKPDPSICIENIFGVGFMLKVETAEVKAS